MSDAPKSINLSFFNPRSDYSVLERRLPHWSQAGVIAFITWRTDDSMPVPVLRRWRSDRHAWLFRHGIDGNADDWKLQLRALPQDEQNEFSREFSERWHAILDAGHGACVLRRPELSKIVADSLKHFDGDRYELTDFVIMPNHVHLLSAFRNEESMLEQCESWKHFQATKLNRILGERGRFWQQDGFDHLVRSLEQFEYLRRYIAENGPKAGLALADYVHFAQAIGLKSSAM